MHLHSEYLYKMSTDSRGNRNKTEEQVGWWQWQCCDQEYICHLRSLGWFHIFLCMFLGFFLYKNKMAVQKITLSKIMITFFWSIITYGLPSTRHENSRRYGRNAEEPPKKNTLKKNPLCLTVRRLRNREVLFSCLHWMHKRGVNGSLQIRPCLRHVSKGCKLAYSFLQPRLKLDQSMQCCT